MLGYVVVDKGELKVREYEIYTGYYCGICKYIGRQWGQLPRMTLSYDAAFLALLLASVDPAPDEPVQEHCIVHHIRKMTVVRNRAIEYAGDVMLILAWYKLLDDAADEGKLYARASAPLMKSRFRKLRKRHPGLCRRIEEYLHQLSDLEKENCGELDRVAEAFAKIMETILAGGIASLFSRKEDNYSRLHETFAKAGYHLGKWIYLIDAVDDIEKDLKEGSYNPLLYRFEYSKDETAEDFRARIDERLRFNLFHYLAVIGESAEALEFQKNSGIIENVIYLGLNRRTEEVLKRLTPPSRSPFARIRNRAGQRDTAQKAEE